MICKLSLTDKVIVLSPSIVLPLPSTMTFWLELKLFFMIRFNPSTGVGRVIVLFDEDAVTSI